jgi:hypothetical protein
MSENFLCLIHNLIPTSWREHPVYIIKKRVNSLECSKLVFSETIIKT